MNNALVKEIALNLMYTVNNNEDVLTELCKMEELEEPAVYLDAVIEELLNLGVVLPAETPEELIEAELIENKFVPTNIMNHRNLRAREEQILLEKAVAGDEDAKTDIIIHNQRLINSIIKRYTYKGIEYDDLIQYGNIGLCKAIESFNLSKKVRFSTHATNWIRAVVIRAFQDEQKQIRKPVYIEELLRRIYKAQKEIGVDATHADLAEYLQVPVSRIKNAMNTTGSEFVMSLDSPIPETDNGITLGDTIEDATYNLEAMFESKERREAILQFIKDNTSDEREEKIILFRFGFMGRILTLDECGKMFDVTRERIRQIESKAIGKFKRNSAQLLASL